MKRIDEIDIELKSEPMNELLSQPPKWMVSSGSGIFLIILVVLILLTWFIKYPDQISGEVVVTSSKAPIELSNQNYIQLKSLDVIEGQKVRQGDFIAQFDIQVKPEDIEKASSYLNTLEKLNGRFSSNIPEFEQIVHLGTFQEQWTTLLAKVNEWNTEQSENLVLKELAAIQREIVFREQLQKITQKKITLSEGEYELMEQQLSGSERLAEQHAISKQTLTQDKRSQTQVMQTVQAQKEQQVQNLISLNALRKEKFKLEHDARLHLLQKATEIQMSLTALRNGLQTWKKSAVWVAPCSGKVLFNKILQVNQFYKANQASIVIVPNGTGYQAIATIVSTGAGKVTVGQKTFIELTDYPKAEFGMLEGRVNRITQIDKEGKYEVRIQFLNQLTTTYQKVIPAKAQLKGTAKIITKNKRLLARFFEQLTDLIK